MKLPDEVLVVSLFGVLTPLVLGPKNGVRVKTY
jgi:hypothetical protein